MDGEADKFLRKLRQIEEHARALTQELGPGEGQNRARLIWGIAAHLALTLELDEAGQPGAPADGAGPDAATPGGPGRANQ